MSAAASHAKTASGSIGYLGVEGYKNVKPAEGGFYADIRRANTWLALTRGILNKKPLSVQFRLGIATSLNFGYVVIDLGLE